MLCLRLNTKWYIYDEKWSIYAYIMLPIKQNEEMIKADLQKSNVKRFGYVPNIPILSKIVKPSFECIHKEKQQGDFFF